MLPNLTTINDRLLRLQDHDFCGSEGHQWAQWGAGNDFSDVPQFAKKFIGSVIKYAAVDFGIPLMCSNIKSFDAENAELLIEHCHYPNGVLNPEDWEIIGQIGLRYAPAHLYPEWTGPRQVHWHGRDENPDWPLWSLSGFEEFIGERR